MQSAIDSYRAGDFQAALEELRVLARQNDPFAQHALGLMYAEGAGTPRDRIKAETGDAATASDGQSSGGQVLNRDQDAADVGKGLEL